MPVRSVPVLLLFVLTAFALSAQPVARFSIVITELFPDPSPSVGLPTSEFIELENVSANAIPLKNWKLSDGSSTATITSDFILLPGSQVIICSPSAVTEYARFGTAIGVNNFPSLNNDADIITLYSPEGQNIHTVAYSMEWYQNDLKRNGGWTLEMIDPGYPCAGIQNWKASTHSDGGTPGKSNSVREINPDLQPPALLRTYTIDSTTIVAVFDEPLDSVTASVAGNYSIDKGAGNPAAAQPLSPLFTQVQLQFPNALQPRTVYTLTVNHISDCNGNRITAANSCPAGVPVLPGNNDVVINELLFNPRPGGYDYIELYNRGTNIIDLKQLYISTRNGTGNLSSISVLSTNSKLFFPGEYLVITENSRWLQQNFYVKDPARILEITSLPSMPDDRGILVLTNLQGIITEELQYDKKWHFALLSNDEGVALERINYNEPAQQAANWTSAASTAGFGTPGYQNSQFRADLQAQGSIDISPAVFSPDNDGTDDFTTIYYKMAGAGYVANITIYDAAGRVVRNLVKNATLAISGSIRWDGLDDNRNRLLPGIYILLTEIFNLQGKTKKFKNAVTLAKKF